jgi:putative transcriptional regulator
MTAFTSLAGHLLVAMPAIGDPRFEQAVILLCIHEPEHAMGVRLDRPVPGVDLRDVMSKLETPGAEAARRDAVLWGGPVESERGFVLHTRDWITPDSLKVGTDMALTATREALTAMIMPGFGPERSVLALGYAGWGEGQVEAELADNVWLIGAPDPALVFDGAHETKWSRALASVGVSAANLSAQMGNA